MKRMLCVVLAAVLGAGMVLAALGPNFLAP
jgi:hypothetical protein